MADGNGDFAAETITIAEAAERLRKSDRHVRHMLERGELTKLTEKGRVLAAEVERFAPAPAGLTAEVMAALGAMRQLTEDLGGLLIKSNAQTLSTLAEQNQRLAAQNETQAAAQVELMSLAGDILLRQQDREIELAKHEHRMQLANSAVASVKEAWPHIQKQVVERLAETKGGSLAVEAFAELSAEEQEIVAQMLKAKASPKLAQLLALMQGGGHESEGDE